MTSRPARALAIVLVAAFAVVWFSTLQYRKLVKPDEGRYAEIPREMVASGDWITPRLNGIKYFEKPALQYWTTAAAFEAFGLHEWTSRLWAALTGFCGVLLVFFAGRRLYGEAAGWLAATVLGSSLLYFLIGHLNTLDMGLTFFLEAAMIAFLLAQEAAPASSAERRWMLAAWAAMALATLSKGLIGFVLPGMVLVLYSLVQRDLGPWKRMHIAWGVALFLAIAAPWFVAVSVANPEFPRFFFVHEHFERFLTKEHGRYQPAWYFAPILLLGLLPWTSVALQALAEAWKRPARGAIATGRFLLLWTGAIFAFFSLSDSKLPSYILPVVPAIALLSGDTLARMPSRTLRWHLAFATVAGAAALAALAWLRHSGAFADPHEPDAATERYTIWLMVATATLAFGALIALWRNRLERSREALIWLAGASLLASATALQGHETLGRSNSAHYIAEAIRSQLKPDAPFYSVAMYDQTLPFYLRRTVTLVDYGDEFRFGLAQEPGRSIPTMEEFKKRWLEDRDAFAIMTEDTYRALRAQGLPMREVARDPRRVVVARP